VAVGSGTRGNVGACWTWFPKDLPASITNQGSYAINGWMYDPSAVGFTGAPKTDDPGYFRNDSNIKRPANTPMFLDAVWPDLWAAKTDLLTSLGPTVNLMIPSGTGNAMLRYLISRHGSRSPFSAPTAWRSNLYPYPGLSNVVFADGHCEGIHPNQFADPSVCVWSASY
jgi:prepilin-type processing-associated H-X9-DG protein